MVGRGREVQWVENVHARKNVFLVVHSPMMTMPRD